MKKNYATVKKIIFVVIGMIFALSLCELFLAVAGFSPGVPKIESQWTRSDDFIKWAYVDIYDPFFKTENGFFYVQRKDLWLPRRIVKYPLSKTPGVKRIFIAGESTARNFDAKILENVLSKYFKAEVINAGMGAYDSYRIEKVTKEIKDFGPDWVFIMIGNNDGIKDYFNMPKIDPVDINSLPYRYGLLRKMRTLNVLSGFFHPEIVLNKNTVEKNFRKNVLKIIKNLKNTNVIFCDLPNNEQYQIGNIFESLKQRTSSETYAESLWKNTMDYGVLHSRIEFLRKAAAGHKNVYVTDLTETIMRYTGGKLDYDVFYDNFHFREETYLLLSGIIAKIIMKKDAGSDIPLKPNKSEYTGLLKKNRVDIPNHDMSSGGVYDEGVWLQFHRKFGDNEYSSYFGKLMVQYKRSGLFETFRGYEKIYADFVKGKNRTRDKYEYLVLYADVLRHIKENEKSERILKTLINAEPDYCEAYLIEGYGYYQMHNYNKAEEYFDIVKRLDGDSKISVSFLNSLKRTPEKIPE